MKKLLVLMFVAIFAVGCNSKNSSNNSVIAKVNTATITKEDFIEKINRLPEWAKNRFQSEEGKREFLEEIIKEELLYQEAKKQGLNKEKGFQDRVEEFKKMTLITALLKKQIEEKVKVDAKEVRDFYDKNPDKFRKEGRLRNFEEVKNSIERRLTIEKQRTSFESYIKKLKGKASKIKINEDALKALTIEEAPE